MRRTFAAALVAVSTALAVVPAVSSSASDALTAVPTRATQQAQQQARQALDHAQAVLAGQAKAAPGVEPRGHARDA